MVGRYAPGMGGHDGRAEESTEMPALAGTCTVADLAPGQAGSLRQVRGARLFRRRLMELGLVPGVQVTFVGVAPLGDPIELSVRESRLSIRRTEAEALVVTPLGAPADPTQGPKGGSTKQRHALKVLP